MFSDCHVKSSKDGFTWTKVKGVVSTYYCISNTSNNIGNTCSRDQVRLKFSGVGSGL